MNVDFNPSKLKGGLTFRSFNPHMHLAAADAIGALCREKPCRVTIKWLRPNHYSIHVNGNRPLPGGLAEFRFSDLARALVSARTEEIEAILLRKPRVCVVGIREVSEFLRMILKFTGRLDQDFCVEPGPNHWRFFNVGFGFLADLRTVRNFIRAAEERKKVLRTYRS